MGVKDNIKPPRLAEWILKRCFRHEDRRHRVGDFEEVFQSIAESRGRYTAWNWYLDQVVRSVPELTKNSIYWGGAMFNNYLKIAFRNLIKHRGYSFINTMGLSVGMATFILIALYVKYEFSFDTYHKNAERIFRIAEIQPGNDYQGNDRWAVTPGPLGPTLMEDFPEVVSATRIVNRRNVLLSYQDNRFLESELYFADPETFEIFSFDLLKGDLEKALDDPFSIILSERMVEKYYGTENPIGKIIRYENRYDLMVTGIMRNIPDNSHFKMDFVVPFRT